MTARRMPLVPVALAFAAGIGLAPSTRGGLAWLVWALAILSIVALLAVGRASWAAVPLLAGAAALGALRGAEPLLPPDHVARLKLPRIARVEGRLAAEAVRWGPGRSRLPLEAERAGGGARAIAARARYLPPADHGGRGSSSGVSRSARVVPVTRMPSRARCAA